MWGVMGRRMVRVIIVMMKLISVSLFLILRLRGSLLRFWLGLVFSVVRLVRKRSFGGSII